MRRNESHSINRAAPVSDGEDRLGVETVRPSPTPPGARDTFGRVHKDAIEVEEQSATGGVGMVMSGGGLTRACEKTSGSHERLEAASHIRSLARADPSRHLHCPAYADR